jgi:Zn-dependent protease
MIIQLLRELFRGGDVDFTQVIIQLLVIAFALLCSLPFHEYAHAWMANRLGDETPRLSGRLTLNPFAHLDLWGTLLMLFVGVGYAKPVPVNPRNMRTGSKKGLALTALAGPVSNIILAFLFLIVSNVLTLFAAGSGLVGLFAAFFEAAAHINVMLAIFNLLPRPPLDGFNILQMFLPYEAVRFVAQYHSIIRYGLMAILLLGWLNGVLSILSDLLFAGLSFIAELPFSFIG